MLPADRAQYRYPLYRGLTAEITFSGRQVSKRDLALLREYLALAEKTLDEEPEPWDRGMEDAVVVRGGDAVREGELRLQAHESTSLPAGTANRALE